jgi:hypothetical protein
VHSGTAKWGAMAGRGMRMGGGMGMQPSIILLKEGTDTSQGKAQLISNINACASVADIVRTTLGPRGMDKLIHSNGKVGTNRNRVRAVGRGARGEAAGGGGGRPASLARADAPTGATACPSVSLRAHWPPCGCCRAGMAGMQGPETGIGRT